MENALQSFRQSRTNPVYIPADSLEDWRALTAQPERHWKPGRSAVEIAKSWHNAEGFPVPVDQVFKTAGEPFKSMKPLLVIPEHKVALNGNGRPSQNDVWVLADCGRGLASITVEGKVDESFDRTIDEWIKDGSSGKRDRLEFLTRTIGLSVQPHGAIRYQLLHRAASALLEAQRFFAINAVMLVHSFSSEDIGFADYQAFTELFGVTTRPNQLVRLGFGQPSNIPLYAAWIRHSIEAAKGSN